MKLQALILSVIIASLSSICYAKAGLIPQKNIDAIVLKFQSAYGDTFNRRDAKAMAALMTENATMQNEWGDVTQGRVNIEPMLIGMMAKLPPGTTLEDTPVASQAVAAGVIVSHGISHRLVPGAAPVHMIFTRVLVRQGDHWQLAATQIARPSTMPNPAAPPPEK